MRKPIVIAAVVLVLVLLAGCNAESIMKAGKAMGKLGDASLAARNSKAVDEAVENVKGFVEASEDAFDWPEGWPSQLDNISDQDYRVSFKENGRKLFVGTVDTSIKKLLAARDSSADDSSLRTALKEEYAGKTVKAMKTKNLYAGLVRESTIGSLLTQIDSALQNPESRDNLVMILYAFGVKGVTADNIESAFNTMKSVELPMPFRSYDYTLLLGDLMVKITSIQEALKTSARPIDLSILTQFQKDLFASIGDRDYQTVGDKIAVGCVYSLLSKIVDIDTAYRKTDAYMNADETHKYSAFFEFVLSEEKDLIDGMLCCLDAVSYIYDVRLDIAGLVAGLV